MYEAEQMSKQKLQEEMALLKDDYNSKVHAIEEHYHAEEDTVAGRGQDMVSVTPTEGSSISVLNTASAEVSRMITLVISIIITQLISLQDSFPCRPLSINQSLTTA